MFWGMSRGTFLISVFSSALYPNATLKGDRIKLQQFLGLFVDLVLPLFAKARYKSKLEKGVGLNC